MENRFFKRAKEKAKLIIDQRERVVLLLKQFSDKLRAVEGNKKIQAVSGKLKLFGRLIRAYVDGSYRHISGKAILSVLAAVIYFVNPFDLFPDFTPILGLTDDVSVLLWVYNSISDELEKFKQWENSKTSSA